MRSLRTNRCTVRYQRIAPTWFFKKFTRLVAALASVRSGAAGRVARTPFGLLPSRPLGTPFTTAPSTSLDRREAQGTCSVVGRLSTARAAARLWLVLSRARSPTAGHRLWLALTLALSQRERGQAVPASGASRLQSDPGCLLLSGTGARLRRVCQAGAQGAARRASGRRDQRRPSGLERARPTPERRFPKISALTRRGRAVIWLL